ncbi:hypothetical protein SLA2020_412710 [Shorea laevis]
MALGLLTMLQMLSVLGAYAVYLGSPTLKYLRHTEAVFRNLMALEQCHYPSKTYICNYVVLLDYLIDTEQDVELLVEKKVIVNNMVATLQWRLYLTNSALGLVELNPVTMI